MQPIKRTQKTVRQLEAKRKEDIDKFNEWVPRAAKLHTETFCMKKGEVKKTVELTGEECVNCKEFVVNGGDCDPL